MRDGFHRQLDLLNADIAMRCHAAGTAISHATEALLCAQISAVDEAVGAVDVGVRATSQYTGRPLSLPAVAAGC